MTQQEQIPEQPAQHAPPPVFIPVPPKGPTVVVVRGFDVPFESVFYITAKVFVSVFVLGIGVTLAGMLLAYLFGLGMFR